MTKTSIRLKYRPSTGKSGAMQGTLYFQLIHNRSTRHVPTSLRILASEWDPTHHAVVDAEPSTPVRQHHLATVRERLDDIRRRLEQAVTLMQEGRGLFTADDIIDAYNTMLPDGDSLFSVIGRHTERLLAANRHGSAARFRQLLTSLRRFRNGRDLTVHELDASLVEAYEAWMRSQNLKRNTRSFYHCRLRTIYNHLLTSGLIEPSPRPPFANVFTGMDTTAKRAISKCAIMSIQRLDLTDHPSQNMARNLFLLSFCLRGMSFIDMAYLRKSDIHNGTLTYCRHKTGRQLSIRWEPLMQRLVDSLPPTQTAYLLPIITKEGAEGRRQYTTMMKRVNRTLKDVALKAGIHLPISTYWTRHSWSTIARDSNISISIISEALGHTSIATTQIYLDSISNDKVDEANRLILKGF